MTQNDQNYLLSQFDQKPSAAWQAAVRTYIKHLLLMYESQLNQESIRLPDNCTPFGLDSENQGRTKVILLVDLQLGGWWVVPTHISIPKLIHSILCCLDPLELTRMSITLNVHRDNTCTHLLSNNPGFIAVREDVDIYVRITARNNADLVERVTIVHKNNLLLKLLIKLEAVLHKGVDVLPEVFNEEKTH